LAAVVAAALTAIGLVVAPDPPAPKPPQRPPRKEQPLVGVPARPVPGYVSPEKVGPALADLAHLLNQFAFLRHSVVQQFEDLDKKYGAAVPPRYNRWAWLTAKRAAIRDLDRACAEGARLEAQFWAAYQAHPAPGKDFVKEDGQDMAKFEDLRIKYRQEWYYTARGHHLSFELNPDGRPIKRWEDQPNFRSPPLAARIIEVTCKALGWSTDQGCRFLAWVDVWATDLLPGHLSQVLTVPLRLMSR
jgi:hypothetical protein